MTDRSIPITYDRWGRMRYHPAFHARHGKPWTTSEQKFLIDHYVADGPELVSFALERTIHTIMTRVYELRCRGVMPTPEKLVFHRRLKREREVLR